MTYIMEGPGEAERLIAKTDRVLTRRRLDWTGLRHGESFLGVGSGAPDELRAGVDEVLADLATTGFDPHAGRRLKTYAAAAALVDIRHEIEPYHRIVGAPDQATAAAWDRKISTIRGNYLERLFPEKAHNAWVFDAFMEFILSEETMTWSLLHLVQGTVRT
jgi:hypothetical protein